MTLKLLFVVVLAVVAAGLSAGPSLAQEAVSVSVSTGRPGIISEGCPPQPASVSTPAEFVLTRTGDVTNGLAVSIAWSGDITLGTTVSPTSVAFAAGSSTAAVTTLFSSVPQSGGGLTLTVTSGAGYQPGDPSVATTPFRVVAPSCPAEIPLVTPPPPLQVNPNFTG